MYKFLSCPFVCHTALCYAIHTDTKYSFDGILLYFICQTKESIEQRQKIVKIHILSCRCRCRRLYSALLFSALLFYSTILAIFVCGRLGGCLVVSWFIWIWISLSVCLFIWLFVCVYSLSKDVLWWFCTLK